MPRSSILRDPYGCHADYEKELEGNSETPYGFSTEMEQFWDTLSLSQRNRIWSKLEDAEDLGVELLILDVEDLRRLLD